MMTSVEGGTDLLPRLGSSQAVSTFSVPGTQDVSKSLPTRRFCLYLPVTQSICKSVTLSST